MILVFYLPLICLGELLNLDGLSIQKHENSILIDGPNVQQTPEQLDVTDVADLIARSFWAGQINPKTPLRLNHQAPDSNLFIVNFGVDSSILDRAHSLKGSKAQLDYNFFPADPVSLLTSISTSKAPNDHGIVGRTWFVEDLPVNAYSSPKSFSSSISFPQAVAGTHPGAKVITGSADKQLALAISQDS